MVCFITTYLFLNKILADKNVYWIAMSYDENNDDVITQHQHTWWTPNVESTTENWISNTIECGLVHLTVMASVSNAMINCRHCVHCKGHSYWPARSFQSPFASIIITRSINCAISTGSWILDHTNFSRPTWSYLKLFFMPTTWSSSTRLHHTLL